jgi:hypothetical protein
LLLQGEQMIADQFLETSLWDLLWSRVIQSLKPDQEQSNENSSSHANNETFTNNPDEALNSMAGSSESAEATVLDWTLISPHGYLCLLQLASRMLTISTQSCIALILKDDYVMFDTLSYILTERFLNGIKKT